MSHDTPSPRIVAQLLRYFKITRQQCAQRHWSKLDHNYFPIVLILIHKWIWIWNYLSSYLWIHSYGNIVTFFLDSLFNRQIRVLYPNIHCFSWKSVNVGGIFDLQLLQVSVNPKLSSSSLTLILPWHGRLRHPLSRLARPRHPRWQGGEGGGDGGRGLRLLGFPQWPPWLLPLHLACQVTVFLKFTKTFPCAMLIF